MTRATLLILLATLCSLGAPQAPALLALESPGIGRGVEQYPDQLSVGAPPTTSPSNINADARSPSKTSTAPLVTQTAALGAISGVATWYADPRKPQGSLYSAAGPRLRAALGSHWRGRTVRVCAVYGVPPAPRCVVTKLSDYCGCPYGRVIDLSWSAFLRLGVPLSRGIVKVSVSW